MTGWLLALLTLLLGRRHLQQVERTHAQDKLAYGLRMYAQGVDDGARAVMPYPDQLAAVGSDLWLDQIANAQRGLQ